jgi:D-alanyl-D-alanine carboxypeptidase
MKRMRRVLLTAATALAVVAVPSAAAATTEDADRAGLRKSLDDVVAAYGVGALVEVRDEHGVWRGTSGVAALGTTRAVPVDGRFRAGSVMKTFVATVVLQLVDKGRLRLDDPVEAWLPGVVPGGDRITVRHLLNHTSGLFDVLRTLTMPPDPAFLDNRWRTWTATELVARALAHPPTSEEPGEVYSYTNTGYLLLGQIIEKVTGKPYGHEIERRIIRPLGLHGTSLPGTSPWIPGPHPRGYVPIQHGDEPPRLVDYTVANPSVMGAGGELISTTSDLNRFFAVLLSGRLVPGHLLDEMKTPAVEGRTYGLGLRWRDTPCGIRVYGNDGDALAYQAWSFSSPDRRHQVTVALTPRFSGDPDDAVEAFLDRAICG